MHRLFVVVLTIAVLAASAWVGVALADYNYVDAQTMSPEQDLTSGYNYWTTNRIWRPAGNDFCVWFDGHAAEVCNTTSNPFATSGSFGYTTGTCSSAAVSDVSPVTCRVYS
jgi:hypothetical protein